MIVSICKEKEDIEACGNYRGITVLFADDIVLCSTGSLRNGEEQWKSED